MYQVRDGKVREVEREFVFSESGSYGEMRATPILRLQKKFCVSEVSEGYQNGVWLCIFAFHKDHKPQFSSIPSLLLVSRYICLLKSYLNLSLLLVLFSSPVFSLACFLK